MIVLTRRHEYMAGVKFEREFLGISSHDVPSRFSQRVGSLKEGFHFTRRIQSNLGWNPRFPKTDLSKVFFEAVASRLESGSGSLRLFSSVGTALDWMYGTDFWLECHLPSGRRSVVRVDLTTMRVKNHYRADVLLSLVNFVEGRHLDVAQEVANRLSLN